MSLKLILGIYGDATLKSGDAITWSSEDDETAIEFFGEFIEEDQADELVDYLMTKGLVSDPDEVEIEVEISEEDSQEDGYMIPAGE